MGKKCSKISTGEYMKFHPVAKKRKTRRNHTMNPARSDNTVLENNEENSTPTEEKNTRTSPTIIIKKERFP